MFMEVLEILFKAWTGEPFSHTGKYYSVPEGISVRPTPLQKPHPPLWFPALSPKTIEWVVKMGSRLMTATTGALSVDDLVRMRETFDQLLDQAEQRSNEAELYIHIPIHVTEKSSQELKPRSVDPAGGLARPPPRAAQFTSSLLTVRRGRFRPEWDSASRTTSRPMRL
jgi:alkanesulfonate monooxygenase SsuD/methylene tetrahydromethanopterin reductase-like flavin-dependent oxidoreductase (luciferase family)